MKELKKTTVYFTRGMWATDDEKREASALGITSFLNASLVTEAFRPFSAAAGAIPECYRGKVEVLSVSEEPTGTPPADDTEAQDGAPALVDTETPEAPVEAPAVVPEAPKGPPVWGGTVKKPKQPKK